MSTASAKTPEPSSSYPALVQRTIEACRLAQESASVAAQGIATASSTVLSTLRDREKELDKLDMEIDTGVTQTITRVTESEARELLACMKFMIGLERIGDLLLSFAVSEDGALHAEKYYRTVTEEFTATRPAFRWRHLAALARVTASEHGHPAPGVADARRLLNV